MNAQPMATLLSAQANPVSVETHALFSTPLWVVNHPDSSSLNRQLRSHAISAMEADAGVSQLKRTNRMGWRSPAFNLEESQLWAPLAAFVRESLACILSADGDYALISTGLNVHLEGGFNVSHVHAHCVVSAVYYIACPPGSGDLVFEDPRVQASFASSLHLFCQDLGSHLVRLSPQEGQLVLFPSWLSHRVEPSGSFEPRISLPINVIPRHGQA
jgi:uncharacterized protein (TIGR02466 family)